jgi:hypothetical protein
MPNGGMQAAKRRANVRWLSNRIKSGKKHATPQQIVALRLADFARMFRSRYGTTLPDDDSGRDDIPPVIHHIAALRQPARKARSWLELWAPWLTLAEQRKLIQEGIANARVWRADQLAWRYNVTREERTVLGLTTIGAVDHGKAARTKRRRERDRQRKARQRQAAGAVPRDQYVATAIRNAKPWEADGISRATWYRRKGHTRLNETETGPATA